MMKRLMDILFVLLSLPFWLPVLLVTVSFVGIFLGRPFFFCQERAGLAGRPFRIIKFRTMSDARDASGHLLPDAQRLTKFGKILRAFSLDELPELINVLRGEMTLVGPRPLPTVYVGRYSAEQSRRLACPPGITGWAQVNGRNLLDWETRIEHDIWYVDNRSLGLDIRILFKTLATVLGREGISAENEATMTEFMGSGRDQDPAPGHESDLPGSPDPFRKTES
jgi:sugar transferase EpsL